MSHMSLAGRLRDRGYSMVPAGMTIRTSHHSITLLVVPSPLDGC